MTRVLLVPVWKYNGLTGRLPSFSLLSLSASCVVGRQTGGGWLEGWASGRVAVQVQDAAARGTRAVWLCAGGEREARRSSCGEVHLGGRKGAVPAVCACVLRGGGVAVRAGPQ